MTNILREATAVDVLIGPFVDLTDGSSSEVGESPAVKLSKNGQALGAKNEATTPVSDADGYYNCMLDATDTGTIGTLILTIAATATALPVRHEYQVMATEIYDALYASDADGFDANGRTDVGAFLGTAVAAATASGEVASNVTEWLGTAVATPTVAGVPTVDAEDTVWDALLTGAAHNINTSAGKRLRQIQEAFVITEGTAAAGAAATITLENGVAVEVDNIYRGDRVVITGGTGVGEHGIIVSYVGSTQVATMSETWVTTPDNTSIYEISPASVDVETMEHLVITAAGAQNWLDDYDGTGYVGGTIAKQSDLTAMGGVAQSATDLKDFADAGYDPATNSVEQVKVNDDAITVANILTTQMTESYATNGTAPTLAQATFAMHQMLMQFGISTTSLTVRQLDDSTTAFVVTLDDATSPTDAKRV